MECRERVLAALNLEEPDRVPCHTILIDANNSDIILGKPEIDDFDSEHFVRIPIESKNKDEPVRTFKTYKILRRLEIENSQN